MGKKRGSVSLSLRNEEWRGIIGSRKTNYCSFNDYLLFFQFSSSFVGDGAPTTCPSLSLYSSSSLFEAVNVRDEWESDERVVGTFL